MIVEWILVAWILKKILDPVFMRHMSQEEYQRILQGKKLEVEKWRP